jgi:hypothetical protein
MNDAVKRFGAVLRGQSQREKAEVEFVELPHDGRKPHALYKSHPAYRSFVDLRTVRC